MRSRLLISVSAAALIAGAGVATAQDKGGPSGGGGPSAAPQSTSPAQQSAPPSSQPGGAMKGGGETKGTTGQGQGQMERGQEAPPPRAQQKMDRGGQPQRAQDNKGRAGTTGQGGQMEQRGQDTPRAQDRRGQETPRAQDQRNQERQDRAQDKSDKKGGATTGQGAAGAGGASLTTEQRTKISTTIRQSNVQPVRNVNFNISVGTVVPRTVTLHPLPPAVIEVYPQWRGYRFVLVEDEIIVIEPGSYRIVAVIAA